MTTPLKYKTEAEFCRDVNELILGGLVGFRNNVKIFCEVPRRSYTNHTDTLLIDYNRKEMLVIEYKLKNPRKVNEQLEFQKINGIGIVNCKVMEIFRKERILSYTGHDSELDQIVQRVTKILWTPYLENSTSMVYYWGYKFEPETKNGGVKSCKRMQFHQLYKKAIKNLMEFYNWQLDFMLVYQSLGFYSVGVSRKFYRQVLEENGKTKR